MENLSSLFVGRRQWFDSEELEIRYKEINWFHTTTGFHDIYLDISATKLHYDIPLVSAFPCIETMSSRNIRRADVQFQGIFDKVRDEFRTNFHVTNWRHRTS